jgi:hypothetical protein
MKLIINGVEASLPPNAKIKYTNSSTILNPLQGAYSVPFVLELNDTNQEIFDYPNHPNVGGNPRKEFTAELWVGSYRLIQGIAKVLNSNTRTININVEAMPGNIQKSLWQKNINEFNIGNEVISTVEKTSNFYYQLRWDSFNLLNTVVYFSADYNVAIEVYADNTLLARSDYTGYTRIGANPTDADLKKRLIEANTNIQVFRGDVNITKDAIFAKVDRAGYNNITVKFTSLVVGDDIEVNPNGRYPKAMTKVNYTTIAQTYYDNKRNTQAYALPQIQNYAFYTEQKDWNGIINLTQNNKIILNDDSVQNRNVVIPQLKFVWAIQKLLSVVGYTPTGNFLTHTDILKLLIFNLYATDKQSTAVTIPFNVYNEIIAYANHLPKMTLAEFFQSLINQFAIGIEFNILTKNVELFFIREVFESTDLYDLTGKLSYEFNSDYAELKKKQLKWSITGSDEMVTDTETIFQPFPLDSLIENEKDKYENIDCRFPSLVVQTLNNVRQIPEIEQPGISPLFGQSKNENPTRLLFWDGSKADNQTNTMKISFYDDNNLHNLFQQKKLSFLNAYTPIKAKTLMNIEEIITFSFKRKIVAYSAIFFCEEISAEITGESELYEVELKLRRYL